MAEPRPSATKRERDQLREQMLARGAPHRLIKDEMMRRWGDRPRQAWRHAYGWSADITADRFNSLHDRDGRAPMSGDRIGKYERWPTGRGTTRPTPHVLQQLAELFGTTVSQLVDDADLRAMPQVELQTIVALSSAQDGPTTAPTEPSQGPAAITYAERDERDVSVLLDPREVVTMAAHEGSERAEEAERRDIGDATLEQVWSDVQQLSHAYMTGDPLSVFIEMNRVRRRLYRLLERHLWPRDSSQLYFLIGTLNGLMSAPAYNLGNARAAEELIRAGWAYATVIDHRPLMAQLRLELAGISYARDPRHSRRLAKEGLALLSSGPNAAHLHLKAGRAAARLGDVDAARQAISGAHEAANRDHHDDMVEIGGLFHLSTASRHFLAGETLLELPGAETEAIAELEQAVALYAAGPEPGEHHHHGYTSSSRVDLAAARLRAGALDGALDALEPVLSLPEDKRVGQVLRRLPRVRRELADRRFSGQSAAARLDSRIEAYAQETIVEDLNGLVG